MDVHVQRTVPISYEMVAKAYQKVKQGGKASGIDGESWEAFTAQGVERQLYVIWNRLSSGSYHPQAVREVEIPKKNGKKRKLGIPTLRDRIAQEVVRAYMETKLENRFHDQSYGYRPMKSSHDALEAVRLNTQSKSWVVDLDIKSFFDELDHELLLEAVSWVHEEKWLKGYIKRWLKMKIERADGSQYDRGDKGTPQGGVISPLLANLFLHFALDMWLNKHYPEVSFVRYADDIVLHCQSKDQADELLQGIRTRLEQVKLELNEDKSKIVYCKDYSRTEQHEHVQFGFLGFSFQPRAVQSHKAPGTTFTGFTAGISKDNQLKIRSVIREILNRRTTYLDLRDLAATLNPKLRGWTNYFSWRGSRQLRSLFTFLDVRLLRWLKQKHRRNWGGALRLFHHIRTTSPAMFYHWTTRYCIELKLTRAV